MVHMELSPTDSILVLKSKLIDGIGEWWEKFFPSTELDIENLVLEKSDFMQLAYAEKNTNYREIVLYPVIYKSKTKEILVYEEMSENISSDILARIILWMKVFISKMSDTKINLFRENIIVALRKYLNINFAHISNIKLIGTVHSELYSNEETKLGLFYLVEVIGDGNDVDTTHFPSARYMAFDELEAYLSSPQIESGYWSQLIFPALKEKIKELSEKQEEKWNYVFL